MADLLGGITVLGHIFNKRDIKENMENNIMKNDNRFKQHTNGTNIYSNNQMHDNMNNMKSLSKNRFTGSRNPGKTGIISKGYNKNLGTKNEHFSDDDSLFSDQMSIASNNSNVSNNDIDFFNPVHFLDKTRKFEDISSQIKPAARIAGGDSYAAQFDNLTFDNPNGPVGNGGLPQVSGKDAGSKRLVIDRDLALSKGFSYFGDGNDMTFDVVDKEHFTHNNMTPNFKSKGVGNFHNSEHRGMQHQRKMELFTGADNRPDYHSGKEEHTPLFSPLIGITNIYGMPALNGVFETRYNPGRERRNEKPFEPIKITPGLGLGPYKQRTTGYVEPVRILPRTVDDIRTASNPKITYESRVVDGQKGSRGAVYGKMQKKRPLRYREIPPSYMVKTFGNNHLNPPRIIGKIETQNLNTNNRGRTESTRQYGPAKFNEDIVNPAQQYGLKEDPKKENYLHAEPFNVHLVDGLKSYPTSETWIPRMTERGKELNYLGPLGNHDNKKSYTYDPVGWTPDMTLREISADTERAGIFTGDKHKAKSINYNDVPDITLREIFSEYERAGIFTGDKQKAKSINFNDIPDITLREIYSEYERAGIFTGDKQKAKSINYNDIPDITLREIYSEYERAGIFTGDKQKTKSINFNDVMDLTLRDIHNKFDRSGIFTGDKHKNKIIDYSDVTDLTMREIYAEKDRVGIIGNTNKNNNRAYDYSDVPDLTMREIYAEKDRVGIIGNTNKNNNKAYDYSDVADLTMREIYAEKDRVGIIGNTNKNNNRAYDYSDVPDLTQRELVGETNHIKPALNDVTFLRTRDDINNSIVNDTRDIISKRRAPTVISQNMGHTLDFTEYRMNTNRIIDNQRINFQNDIPSSNNRIRFEGTHVPKIKWFFNNNEDRQLLRSNIDSNPHINNILHKAESTTPYKLDFDNKFKIL